MEPIKIALADDEVLFRKGISFLLQREKNLNIIFEASDGGELIHFLENTQDLPEIIVIDLKMPEINGVEATKIIRTNFPDIKIIALSSYNTKSFIANMIEVGAAAYLIKNTTPQELIKTINEVHTTGFYYTDYILTIINECLAHPKKKLKSKYDLEKLTNREIEILKLICRQYSGQEIADKLFLSTRTVEGHRNNLLRKTECKNMIGLIIYAIQNDYITIDNLIE